MADDDRSKGRIQELLNERLKVLQWLDRLKAAPDDIPVDVRERVRLDYQTRLDDVARQLQGFTDELQAALLEHQHGRDDLTAKREDASRRLAEAKLRHAVGEYEDRQWEKISREIGAELEEVSTKITSEEQEVSRLEDVLGLIRQKPPSTEVRKAIPMVEPPPPPSAAPAPRRPRPAPAPRKAPAQPAASAGSPVEVTTAQADTFDELEFLKSVTDDKGKDGLSVTHGPPPPEMPTPPPAPAAEEGTEAAGPTKTLRCGECGVMNFPTEWYCERCGAELAAM